MSAPASSANVSPRALGLVYLVNSGEFLIAAPVRKVWYHMVHYTTWQNYPIVEHLSGVRGGEGELVRLRKEEEGFSFPAYRARTIKLEPDRRIVWKTFPEPGTQEIEFFGIVDFQAQETPGGTRFSYNSTYEFQVPHTNEGELEVYRKQQQDNFEVLFAAVFPKLKEVAEKS